MVAPFQTHGRILEKRAKETFYVAVSTTIQHYPRNTLLNDWTRALYALIYGGEFSESFYPALPGLSKTQQYYVDEASRSFHEKECNDDNNELTYLTKICQKNFISLELAKHDVFKAGDEYVPMNQSSTNL